MGIAIIAALYFGREVFPPIVLVVLLGFMHGSGTVVLAGDQLNRFLWFASHPGYLAQSWTRAV